jgi:hypothetical protein
MSGAVSRSNGLILALLSLAFGCGGSGAGEVTTVSGGASSSGGGSSEVAPPNGVPGSGDAGAPEGPVHASASVTYPFLIPATAGSVDYFPTVFAHLLGQPLDWTDISTSLACVVVTNSAGAPLQATVRVELTGYSTPLSETVSVPANTTSRACLNPTPSLDLLYALTAPIPGQVHTTVTPVGTGAPILDDVHAVTITTGQTVFERKVTSGGASVLLDKYQAVLSMPKDPQVQGVLAPAARRSAWGTFGAGGYAMHLDGSGKPIPRNPVTVSVASGGVQVDPAYFLAGESVTLNVDTVGCETCALHAVDLFVLDQAQLGEVSPTPSPGGIAAAVLAAPGATSTKQLTFTAPVEGSYYFVFSNFSVDGFSRSVTYHRTGTQADTVIDALQATYGELQSWGISYVNVAFSFFDATGTGSVRWPSTVFTDHAANCIDGSMLFASVLEALQLEPVVVFIPNHAFMGVRQSPGDTRVWPIETTLLGSAPFANALAAGIDQYLDPNIPPLAVMDVKAARLAGLTPIPE